MKRTLFRHIALLAGLMILPLTLSAQVEKQVEVTKNYTTRISVADKLGILPDYTDTVKLRPEIDYRLTPRAVNTPLESSLFRPARLTYWEFNRATPLYVKAGLGYPFNSVVDGNFTTQHPDIGYATLYLNHWGDYSRIRNEANQKATASQLYNRLGGAAGYYFGRNIAEAELSYENRLDHRYGATVPDDEWMVGSRINYGRLQARLRLGNDFESRRKISYNVEGYTRLLHDNSENLLTTRGRQFDGGGSGRIAFRWQEHHINLGARFDGAWGRGEWRGDRNLNIQAGATYTFTRELMDFKVGAVYHHSIIALRGGKRETFNYLLPKLHLQFNVGGGNFVPYLAVDGEVTTNDYGHLVEANPYIPTGLSLQKNTVSYLLRLGADGNLNNKFAYRFYLEMRLVENANYYYGINLFDEMQAGENFLLFGICQGRRDVASIGGELRWRPGRNWLLEMMARAYSFDTTRELHGVVLSCGLPTLEAALRAGYTHERFSIKATADLTSCRYWSRLAYIHTSKGLALGYHDTFQAPITVDLKLQADYHLSNRITLFLEGRNLLNQRLYDWPNYPLRGIGFTAGVKMNF